MTLKAQPPALVVFDRNGNVMATLYDEDRAPVKLKDVPQALIDAVIAIEDRKFYEHHGVDWAGTIRALFKNVDAGTIEQGGSTITAAAGEEHASAQGRKRDLKTKVERRCSRSRLEQRAHQEPDPRGLPEPRVFGNNAFGIEVAAERYFNETMLAQLDLAGVGVARRVVQSPDGARPDRASGEPRPAAAARCSTRWSRTHKITARSGRRREVGAAADAGLPERVAAQLLHRRGAQLLLDDPNPNVVRRSRPTCSARPERGAAPARTRAA